MGITNPSFETADTLPGEAAGWTYVTTSALRESAEFGIAFGASASNKGVDSLEDTWRNRFTPKDLSGTPSDPEDWAHYDYSGGFIGRGAVPGSGHLVALVFVVESDLVASGNPVVTVHYTLSGGGTGSAATTLPNGALEGREFAIALSVAGITEITNITVSPALTAGAFHIEGGLALAPFNDAAKFAFSDTPGVDLFPFVISGGSPVERFENGWDNDAGFRNNFDALLSEAANIDGQDEESFEDTWTMPLSGTITPPWNESRIVAFHPYVASEELPAATTIVTGANDTARLEYTAGGTTGVLAVVIAAGVYTQAELATAIEVAIDAALDVDAGSADNTSFNAYAVAGVVYLENTKTGSALILQDAGAVSLWDTLGIEAGTNTTRYVESDRLDAGAFDVGTPEAVEDFEEEWRSNETYKSAFTLDMPPPETELQFADFDTTLQNFEDFETEWTLTL